MGVVFFPAPPLAAPRKVQGKGEKGRVTYFFRKSLLSSISREFSPHFPFQLSRLKASLSFPLLLIKLPKLEPFSPSYLPLCSISLSPTLDVKGPFPFSEREVDRHHSPPPQPPSSAPVLKGEIERKRTYIGKGSDMGIWIFSYLACVRAQTVLHC